MSNSEYTPYKEPRQVKNYFTRHIFNPYFSIHQYRLGSYWTNYNPTSLTP